ncbi:MAG: GNAT family N-acetyltransferase [Actinomycetota bacterium]|nr:GNAT family N-acetyltransferase [Actinomycetota bacterium]
MPVTTPLPAAIRPATTEDLDAVVAVLWAVGAEGRWIGTEVPFDRQVRRARMADRLARDDAAGFVADAPGNGGVVGNIGVVVAPYGVADIGMALLDGWRGQGLGTALLDAGLAWARDAGAHKAALEVWPDNAAALALYRRFGFVEEGCKRRHYRRANGELWDAILMGRHLR